MTMVENRESLARPGNRVRDAARTVASGLMAGLLVVVLGIAVLAIVIPAATGARALTVRTSSMEPTLPPGTLIVTRPTPVSEIAVGDVLTFQLRSGEESLVTHRVVQRHLLADGEERFTTQGDNNPVPDVDSVRPVQVVGTLWYSVPYLGWVPHLLGGSTRVWLIPAAVVALFGYAAWALVSGLRERRAERRAERSADSAERSGGARNRGGKPRH